MNGSSTLPLAILIFTIPLFVNYYHQCFLMMVGINRTPKKNLLPL